MRFRLRGFVFWGILMLGLLSVARALPVTSLYRAYQVSRSSGAVLFSLVQAIGMHGSDSIAPGKTEKHVACRFRPQSTRPL